MYSFYTSILSQIDGLPQQPAVNAYPTQFLDTEDSLVSDELEDHTEVCGWEGVVLRQGVIQGGRGISPPPLFFAFRY